MPYNDPDPKKDYTRQKTYKAIVSGKLNRPSYCESCLIACIPHAHHNDYDKSLDVCWLCPDCHKDVHRKFGGQYNRFDLSIAISATTRILIS